ncbi:Rne/Rng family ribonuclease [Bacillus luteolus]|uniref:Ribonuclease G n=1 Tax=Litchfieldia luteola TaxID=682179 RepID=A0ABR9QI16_9BACI|nr:Rne/Rng family ribonuclease [Cytobacillus luteolus]MBE4908136.1 Rne/Rng family ribonuclease [Cytobacillus luteolus]MBP1942921.1 ribonuclease G [Cytobacillus luteolus]
MSILVLNINSSEKRGAIVKNNKVEQFILIQPARKSLVGNIYSGRVIDVIPGMEAAFVDIGIDKNGYLPIDEFPSIQNPDKEKRISQLIHQGEEIVVQVIKDSSELKGPKLTRLIEIQGDYIIYQPEGKTVSVSRKIRNEQERDKWHAFATAHCTENEGLIIRTSCEKEHEDTVLNELSYIRSKYQSMLKIRGHEQKTPSLLFDKGSIEERARDIVIAGQIEEIVVDDFSFYQRLKVMLDNVKISTYSRSENIFSYYGVEHEIEKCLNKTVVLDNGGYIIIESTEAMTVIDVNSGKFHGKTNLRETILKTNIEAAREVARQIRLRDIGGIIVVDFINMRFQEDKHQVLDTIKMALRADPNDTKILGFTKLGLVELTRKKVYQTVNEILCSPCSTCEGTGMVLSAESIAYKIERELWELKGKDYEAVWIEAPESVIRCITGEKGVHKKRLEETLNLAIYLTIQKTTDRKYTIRHVGSKKEIEERIKLL